jgi:hypothetical protein
LVVVVRQCHEATPELYSGNTEREWDRELGPQYRHGYLQVDKKLLAEKPRRCQLGFFLCAYEQFNVNDDVAAPRRFPGRRPTLSGV